MLLIFGFRNVSKVLAVLTVQCNKCGQVAAQRCLQARRRFTLFFIPVVTVSKKHYRVCVACGTTWALTKEQADEMVAVAERQQAQRVQQSQPGGPSELLSPPAPFSSN